MTKPLPPTAVVRVSRGNFDPANFETVKRMAIETGSYLVPAIRRLEGLITYYAAVSPDGSMVHVSVWDSEAHASQMGSLREMVVRARADAQQSGVEFIPVVNYPLVWTIEGHE